jgi:hypothetical protein
MTFSLPEVRALPRWSPCLFRDEGAVSGVKGAQTLISAAQDPNRAPFRSPAQPRLPPF